MSANCLYLHDEVLVNPYWPSTYDDVAWRGRVIRFERRYGTELVLVEALERSDDPMVENEMWFPFRALRRV